ncbi:MAG: spore coat protein [Oscillospiraceae bacterium]|nr:spore coat protein [Oscillospiraceae bacterium]
MNIQTNSHFDDKSMMNDALMTQKHITGTFNTFANECCTPKVRDEFMSILNEEHQIQSEVFTEISKRGWYQTQPAEQQKVDQAKTKFTNMAG